MAKLTWGVDGERHFEAGIDRGVLYVPGLAGVPWNGLKSVKEAPTGGDPQPFYLDGFKYANVSAAEEYAATIEALSSPPEFAACDGTKQLAAGLFVTQQPRKSFGFSYRTRVGNDITGFNGHKIHLVYNALAEPSGRDNATLSNQTDPLGLAWGITTRPPLASGYKPSAHMIIETKDLDTEILEAIETALYGDEATTPSLPSQSDLVGLLSGLIGPL